MAAQLTSTFPHLSEALQNNAEASAELDQLHQAYLSEITYLQAKLAKVLAEQRQERGERFAASSEKQPQYSLFNEAEEVDAEGDADTDDEADETTETTITVPAHKRKVPGRKP